jgi:hypothetical protein
LHTFPISKAKGRLGYGKGGKRLTRIPSASPHVNYDEKVRAFFLLLRQTGFQIVYDWPEWDEGRAILSDPEKIAKSDLLTLRKLMTALVRSDRFVEGVFLSAITDGRISLLLRRLKTLKDEGKLFEDANEDSGDPSRIS